jgi:hypothetical protein
MARAIVDGRGKGGAPAPPPGPRRRAIVALYRVAGEPPLVATALGGTEADSVAAAADALNLLRANGPVSIQARLELDIPTALEGATLGEDMEVPLTSIGLQGVFVTREDGKAAAVLPSEIVQREMFHQGKSTRLDHDKIGNLLAARAGIGIGELAGMRAYLFEADVHVEPPPTDPRVPPREPPLPVVRGMVAHPSEATPEGLLAAARLGAEYLVRIMNPEGRYVYLYHPVADRDDSQYGWLRHAGTTYALLEAYEEFHVDAYLEHAERALRYLGAHLRDAPSSQGKYALDTNDEEQQKVGGAGLALLAFAKDAAVTGKRTNLETMRALARFIMKQQYEDGHFRANADVEHDDPTVKKLKREPVYYPGEAVLSLIRLYAIDAQEAYLDSARRGADYVVHFRDADVPEDRQEHDHWMAYALNDLYRVTKDPAYLDHAFKIARAIQKKQHGAAGAPAPDWAGTFYEGQTTPGATRVEAYDAQIALSRFAGKPDEWILGPARAVASSMLGQQFNADNDYWLPNPAKARGGVRESLFVHDVRIDYVQHAMSAWLHLARILRDPAYGKTGVPSQDPVAVALP